VELVLEANAVGEAVRHHFMATQSSWLGTASELLPLLTAQIPESASREREWPKRADTLGGKLRRVAPALRRTGIHIAFDRGGHARTRIICIEKRAEAAPEHRGKGASAASAEGANPDENNYLDADGCGRHADSADGMRTAPSTGGVCANPLKSHAEYSADSADAFLHPFTGNGPVSDVDAVLAELAERDKA